MIQTHRLHFAYKNAETFKFPDIDLPQGKHALLLGASGSGKTTLLNLLCGLLRPQTGSVKIGKHDLSQFSQSQIDRFRGENIGMIFQKSYFLPALTIENNLLWAQRLAGRQTDKKQISQQLEQVGLLQSLKKYPYELSIGEQQRVSIARALLHQPQVVLADEPTSALDDANCEKVLNIITSQSQQAEATLLIVTHDARVKHKIDKHYVL
jgi:putative ABC transport system ATP-binding protein